VAKLTESQRNSLKSSEFVFPKTRKYPINSKGHAQWAIRIGSIQLGKGLLSVAEYNKIVTAVNNRWGFNARFKK
jgi:hypothetical protein